MHIFGFYEHILRKNKNQPLDSGPAGLHVDPGQVEIKIFTFKVKA